MCQRAYKIYIYIYIYGRTALVIPALYQSIYLHVGKHVLHDTELLQHPQLKFENPHIWLEELVSKAITHRAPTASV